MSRELQDFLDSIDLKSESACSDLELVNQGIYDDPDFKADMLKSVFVEELQAAMEAKSISQSHLGRLIGKTRQYISKVLDEDSNVNFTIETMVGLLHHCGVDLIFKTKARGTGEVGLPIKDLVRGRREVCASFYENNVVPMFESDDWRREPIRSYNKNEICLSA